MKNKKEEKLNKEKFSFTQKFNFVDERKDEKNTKKTTTEENNNIQKNNLNDNNKKITSEEKFLIKTPIIINTDQYY